MHFFCDPVITIMGYKMKFPLRLNIVISEFDCIYMQHNQQIIIIDTHYSDNTFLNDITIQYNNTF